MFDKVLGLIQTYGIINVAVQAVEKLRTPKRCIRQDTVMVSERCASKNFEKMEEPDKQIAVIFVLHRFFPDGCGGTEQFTKNLASELKKRDHKVAVCAYSEYERHQYTDCTGGILWRMEEVDGIPVFYFRKERPKLNLIKDIEANGDDYTGFMEMLKERYKPDVFHFTHMSRVSGIAQYCRQNGIPYVVTITDFFALCHYSVYVRKDGCFCSGSCEGRMCAEKCVCITMHQTDRYERSKEILETAETVTAPSRFVMGIFKRELPELEVKVIPHSIKAVNAGRNPDGKRNSGRFIYVGSLTPEKGVHTLIQAFSQMPDFCALEIYGGGRQGYVKKLRKAAAGDRRVTFAGAVSHEMIERAYLDADCVVIPSEVPETYCMVLHEALASGRFVVASRIGAIPEAVAEGRSGLLFEPGNAGDLLEKMLASLNLKNTEHRDLDPLSEIRTYLGIYGRICQGESSRNAYTGGEEGTAV